MAASDAVVGSFQIALNGAAVDIRPSTTQQWIIHNLYYSGACKYSIVDSGGTILIDSDTGSGARLGTVFHLTNSHYLRVENTGTGTLTFSYDGLVTKEG